MTVNGAKCASYLPAINDALASDVAGGRTDFSCSQGVLIIIYTYLGLHAVAYDGEIAQLDY